MIRIADGPPSEAGDYKYSKEGKTWVAVNVFLFPYRDFDELCFVSRDVGGVVAVNSRYTIGWQWSTRIPDPVAETEG